MRGPALSGRRTALVEIPDHDLPANVAELPGVWADWVVIRLGSTWTGCSLEVDGHPETIRIETNDLRTAP